MSLLEKLTIRGIRNFGTDLEDEQVSTIEIGRNKLRGKLICVHTNFKTNVMDDDVQYLYLLLKSISNCDETPL